MSLTPSTLFPTAMQHYPPCTLFSPTILLTSSASTDQSLSNSTHITNKCSTSSPAPLSHYTPHIYNRFTSLNNPAELVLRLNSSSMPSCPCTDLTYHSIPSPFFANLYYFNALLCLLDCIEIFFDTHLTAYD